MSRPITGQPVRDYVSVLRAEQEELMRAIVHLTALLGGKKPSWWKEDER